MHTKDFYTTGRLPMEMWYKTMSGLGGAEGGPISPIRVKPSPLHAEVKLGSCEYAIRARDYK